MNAQEYIIKGLNVLIDGFPQLKVEYELDESTNSHFIEVLPKEEFQLNERYANFEANLIFNFIERFPFEEITFISKGDIYEIKNPVFVKEGFLYDLKVYIDQFSPVEFCNDSEINIEAFKLSFNDSYIEIFEESFSNYINLNSNENFNNKITIEPIHENPTEAQTNFEYSLAA